MSKPTKQSKATIKLKRRGQALVDMTKSEGWEVARKSLWLKINDLQSIFNLDSSDADAMAVDARSRIIAIETLKEWLQEIEGDVSQYNNNFEDDIEDDDYIIND